MKIDPSQFFETLESPKQATETLKSILTMLESEVQVISHTDHSSSNSLWKRFARVNCDCLTQVSPYSAGNIPNRLSILNFSMQQFLKTEIKFLVLFSPMHHTRS